MSPDDVDALRTAGRAALEAGTEDAADLLGRAAELEPGDAATWHDLGIALVSEGRVEEAADALQRAVELRPGDATALIDLAHTTHVLGRPDDAVAALEQAVELEPGNIATLRSLVVMLRGAGRTEDALAAAGRITELQPDDALAMLDTAELSLELDRIDDAVAAFSRLRAIDLEPEHETYAYHGMIEAELRRDAWRRVLDLAVEATRVDRYGRTTDLLAFAVAQVFGEGDREAPSRAEIDETLAASRAEHRRLHGETVVG